MVRRGLLIGCPLLAALALAAWLAQPGCGRRAPAPAPGRMAERLERLPGLKNVGRLSPVLYRGAQPEDRGLDALKAMGIRTVVNLRHFHGDHEEQACRERGLGYERIMLASSEAPSDEDLKRFLQVVTDPARQPVYFHCKLGCDRTGTMCACYRMAVQGWTLADALAEMDAYGFHPMWKTLRACVEGFPARKEALWPRAGS